MTQATSDKTQLGNQTWRRHTDPPGLWIFVVIVSVTLHLLGIWLIRFSGSIFSLQQDSASVIPIDFVEVAPVKQTNKSVVSRKSPVKKPPVSSTKPVVRNNSQRNITPKITVGNGIALRDNTAKKKVTPKKQPLLRKSQPARKKATVPSSRVKKQVTQLKRTPRQKPPFSSTVPIRKPQQPLPLFGSKPATRKPQQPLFGSKPATRKPQQPLFGSKPPTRKPPQPLFGSKPATRKPPQPLFGSKPATRKPQQPLFDSKPATRKPQQPLFGSKPPTRKPQQPLFGSKPPTRKPQQPLFGSKPPTRKPPQPLFGSNTPNKNTGNQPWNRPRGDIKLGTGKKLDSNPLPNQPSANVNSQAGLLLVRVNPLSRQDILARKFINPPEVMAKYIGNRANRLDISIRNKYPGLKDAKLIVSLVIDKNGKFEQAHVLSIEPRILAANRSQYQKFLDEHFRNQKFIPASTNSGAKPEVSNLYIRVAIETN